MGGGGSMGQANASLKNNRNLLKKRKTIFRRNRSVSSLTDDKLLRDKSKDSLITLSASERKAIGRKIRVKRRIETVVIVFTIGRLLWWIFV